MAPLTLREVKGFELESVFVSGMLPPHYLSMNPLQDLRAYIADYLKEEIVAEANIQNIPSFTEFLKIAAIGSGELLNYTNVGRESGVSAKIVRAYFQILEDTLLGFRVQPWRKSKGRRLIETEKFYLFDVGVTNYLARRQPKQGTPEFGHSFEQLMLMELKAYQAYRNPELDIRYWRTSTGFEVDFVLDEMTVAIEVKASDKIHQGHLRGLKALMAEQPVKRAILVCQENLPKKIDPAIDIWPWRLFLDELWSGNLGV
jgi:predicted AAA+ superfamily ATPase